MSEHDIKRRGLMLVLSSPSGAGKTTLSRLLLADDPNITMSVSATTRKPRPGEKDGVDYYFLSTEDFGLKVNRDEFLEHAKVFDNYYGTPRAPVEEALSEGRDVLFDIDWQGTQQLMETAGEDIVRVFILPPSGQELEQRLKTRAQDPAEVVAARMAKASDEISHYTDYDYIIVNHEVDKSLAQLKSILTAERLKRKRQVGLSNFVRGLQQAL
ncbi:guanylate kinase [Tepidicaulis sp. LMO-SS28]|uniref:guanylate kinase n=1 Tax=Tepidicaulis sp. LMO-SS28 TaxID=3447455 RepID=UPI003EE1CEB3